MVYRLKDTRKAERRRKKRHLNARVKLVRCGKCGKRHPARKNHKCGTRRKLGPNHKDLVVADEYVVDE